MKNKKRTLVGRKQNNIIVFVCVDYPSPVTTHHGACNISKYHGWFEICRNTFNFNFVSNMIINLYSTVCYRNVCAGVRVVRTRICV